MGILQKQLEKFTLQKHSGECPSQASSVAGGTTGGYLQSTRPSLKPSLSNNFAPLYNMPGINSLGGGLWKRKKGVKGEERRELKSLLRGEK